jgi:hypothetical protein
MLWGVAELSYIFEIFLLVVELVVYRPHWIYFSLMQFINPKYVFFHAF